MTDKYLIHSIGAIVIGIGAGMLLSVAGQKFLNGYYQATCKDRANHSLVYTHGFLGDTYYCVKSHLVGR